MSSYTYLFKNFGGHEASKEEDNCPSTKQQLYGRRLLFFVRYVALHLKFVNHIVLYDVLWVRLRDNRVLRNHNAFDVFS